MSRQVHKLDIGLAVICQEEYNERRERLYERHKRVQNELVNCWIHFPIN